MCQLEKPRANEITDPLAFTVCKLELRCVQVDQHGNQLGDESTQFVWLGKYASRFNIVPEKYAAEIVTPLGGERLDGVLMQLQQCACMSLINVTHSFIIS